MYDLDMIKKVYKQLPERIDAIKARENKFLTLSEKILFGHLASLPDQHPDRGKEYNYYKPDRVAMQDATAQMALLQFINSGKQTTAVPTTVHCDHLIRGEEGAETDNKVALAENREVYDFLESASQKFEIDFWPPGSGIIHQILLENYIFPGGMVIGTDSHTVNGGGLGMIAIGVGGADAVDVMAGEPWELKMPEIIGVKLTGEMFGWTASKDVILKLAGILTAKGGTNRIIEYFGEGAKTISATGKATICNMGAEVGATTSIFPYDETMSKFLSVTNRKEVAKMAWEIQEYLQADQEVLENPEAYYDQVIPIDLSQLKPHINGPFTPDAARVISTFKKSAEEMKYPVKASAVLVGSCTNSSYEDFRAVANILQQAKNKGLALQTDLWVTPGSESIRKICEKEGILAIIEQAGGIILSNACGPCIGQWKRKKSMGKNAIVTTFNRNFAGRNDGNPRTHAFITSPELATAIALKGEITFDPENDWLTNAKGDTVQLKFPDREVLPDYTFPKISPKKSDEKGTEISVAEDSDRIQLLEPFDPLKPADFLDMRLLVKIKGKCTTDHISMAGLWLKYRGHLENISDNLLLGAENAFYKEKGLALNQETKEYERIAFVGKFYKKRDINSVIIAEDNYGEGSSREHAAMEPRFLGVKAVIAKSFARIHETNLKKQGVLALTFADSGDYDKIKENDRFTIAGIANITPANTIGVEITHDNGKTDTIITNHTYNEKQIEWLKAGSALNVIRQGGAE